MLGYDFWIQLVVVLIALFYGARKGGMALGLIGGIGLLRAGLRFRCEAWASRLLTLF